VVAFCVNPVQFTGKSISEVFMKNKKEIVISPTRLVTILIVFLILVTAGFVLAPRIPNFFVQKSTGLTAEAAARAGVEAFLSVDAKAGKNAWTSKICDASTPTGCKLAEKVYASMVWPSIQAQGLRFSCKTVSASQVQLTTADTANELWELKAVCKNLDTGETNNNVTRAIVSGSADAGWKFERILFDEETQK
jgi:hypothetical protein